MSLPLASADAAQRQAQWQWLLGLLRRCGLHRARRLASMPPAPGAAVPEGMPPLAHERWLASHCQLGTVDAAAVLLQTRAASLPARPAGRQAWLLRLVHLHLGRDHLVLGHAEPGQGLAAQAAHWQEVLQEALEKDWSLQAWSPGNAQTFLVLETPEGTDWQPRSGLHAAGRSIEAYLPQGSDARQWRRFLNHAQMLLHEHPLNLERAHQGLPAINGLWLEGRLEASLTAPPQALRMSDLGPVLQGDTARAGPSVWWIDDWIAPASMGDEAGWRSAWEAFAETLSACPPRADDAPRHWHFFGEEDHLALESRRSDHWKIWRQNLPSQA